MAVKVALYVRVSTVEQVQGYSIGEQIDRLNKYCAAMGWTVYETYVDSHTGSKMDRPGLQNMIAAVKAHKVGKVVVYKLDRLSRSQKDTLYLIEDVFLGNGVGFVSMSENFDTSTAFGRAMIGVLAVFAQLEREQIKERMMMGKQAMLKEGKYLAGHSPLGYNYSDGILTVNEVEAAAVRELFENAVSGMSLHRICADFIQKGYRDTFSEAALRYILKNRLYIGYVRSGNEWIKGIHEPIVPLALFEEANNIIQKNSERYHAQGLVTGRVGRTTYLGGLIHCKWCGALYGKEKHSGAGYVRHPVYICYSRGKQNRRMVKDPSCKNKIYRMEELDEMVFDQIRKLKLDPAYMGELQKERKDDTQKITAIRKQLKTIGERRSRLIDLYSLGKFDADELDAKVMQLDQQAEKLSAELERLLSESDRLPEKEAVRMIQSFDDALQKGSFDDVRALLEALIERIDIDGDTVEIHWNFA